MKKTLMILSIVVMVIAIGILPLQAAQQSAKTRSTGVTRGPLAVGLSLGMAETGQSPWGDRPSLPPSFQFGALGRYLITNVIGLQGELTYAASSYEYNATGTSREYSVDQFAFDLSVIAKEKAVYAGMGFGYGSVDNELVMNGVTTTSDSSGIRWVFLLGVDIPIDRQISLGAQVKGIFGATGDISSEGATWDTALGGMETKTVLTFNF